jgi:hypothetical protein
VGDKSGWYLKPELITLTVILLALPLFGAIAYRTISFQITEVALDPHRKRIFPGTQRVVHDVSMNAASTPSQMPSMSGLIGTRAW